jgi:hypothetical protein
MQGARNIVPMENDTVVCPNAHASLYRASESAARTRTTVSLRSVYRPTSNSFSASASSARSARCISLVTQSRRSHIRAYASAKIANDNFPRHAATSPRRAWVSAG